MLRWQGRPDRLRERKGETMDAIAGSRIGRFAIPLGIAIAVVLLLMAVVPTTATSLPTSTTTVVWDGNGDNSESPAGTWWHFVLTKSNSVTTVSSATLTVEFSGSGTATASAYDLAPVRFYVQGTGHVVSASATVTYTGEDSFKNLTISHRQSEWPPEVPTTTTT